MAIELVLAAPLLFLDRPGTRLFLVPFPPLRVHLGADPLLLGSLGRCLFLANPILFDLAELTEREKN
jgi:hypothetical protein